MFGYKYKGDIYKDFKVEIRCEDNVDDIYNYQVKGYFEDEYGSEIETNIITGVDFSWEQAFLSAYRRLVKILEESKYVPVVGDDFDDDESEEEIEDNEVEDTCCGCCDCCMNKSTEIGSYDDKYLYKGEIYKNFRITVDDTIVPHWIISGVIYVDEDGEEVSEVILEDDDVSVEEAFHTANEFLDEIYAESKAVKENTVKYIRSKVKE